MTKTRRFLRTLERWAVVIAATTLAGMFFGVTAGFVMFLFSMICLFLGAVGRSYKSAERADAGR